MFGLKLIKSFIVIFTHLKLWVALAKYNFKLSERLNSRLTHNWESFVIYNLIEWNTRFFFKYSKPLSL